MSGLLFSQSTCKLVFVFMPIYIGCIKYMTDYDPDRATDL